MVELQGIAIPSTVGCQMAEHSYPVNMELEKLSNIYPMWMTVKTLTFSSTEFSCSLFKMFLPVSRFLN